MKKEQINKWIDEAYAINKGNGFHDPEHPHKDEVLLMLITSEIAEAMEADRNGRQADLKAFLFAIDFPVVSDDVKIFRFAFHSYIKDTFADEIADVVIRCCDYLGSRDLKYERHCPSSFPNGFYDTFAEKGWEWVMILADTSNPVESRVCHLIYEALWFCENHGIDIERHIELKLRYNSTRPHKHGKAY